MAQEEVVTVKQYFDSLRGEQRTQELLALADSLMKVMADGSKLVIEYPDGSMGQVMMRRTTRHAGDRD